MPLIVSLSKAREVDLPARSFDLARPGVEPPLFTVWAEIGTGILFIVNLIDFKI